MNDIVEAPYTDFPYIYVYKEYISMKIENIYYEHINSQRL